MIANIKKEREPYYERQATLQEEINKINGIRNSGNTTESNTEESKRLEDELNRLEGYLNTVKVTLTEIKSRENDEIQKLRQDYRNIGITEQKRQRKTYIEEILKQRPRTTTYNNIHTRREKNYFKK